MEPRNQFLFELPLPGAIARPVEPALVGTVGAGTRGERGEPDPVSRIVWAVDHAADKEALSAVAFGLDTARSFKEDLKKMHKTE